MNKFSTLLISCLGASCLMAQDVSIGLVGSTLGGGVEATTSLTNNLNVRGLVTGFNYSKSTTESDISYDGDLKMLGAGAMLDYYPFESGVRLSVGGIYNGTKLSLTGTPASGSTYEINGITYSAAEVGTLTGKVEYGKVMPYIGIGFANPLKGSAFTVGMDIGALFGTPETSLEATGAAANPALAADIEQERQELKKSAGDLTAYPYIAISLSYRF